MDKIRGMDQAKILFLDGDFEIIKPGSFIYCAHTGKPIMLEDLRYWNVTRQEAYYDAEAAFAAYQQYQNA